MGRLYVSMKDNKSNAELAFVVEANLVKGRYSRFGYSV